MSLVRKLAVLPIRAYQRFLSPLKPPTCRFHPSCSHYAAGAVQTHGLLKGFLLSTWRILRCQPFSVEGPDPVPPIGDWRMPFRRGYRRAWLEPTGEEEPAAEEPPVDEPPQGPPR